MSATTTAVEDNSAAAYASSSLNSLATRSDAARWRDELMDAIAAMPANFLAIRNMLSTIATREDLRKPVLLSASVSTRHKLRTPLMAAASTGEMAIVGPVLATIGDVFRQTSDENTMVENRTKEMRRQMEMVDIDGMTVLMHACSGSSSAAFRALSQCVEVSQSRAVTKAKDAEGMTLLHHAVNGKAEKNASTRAARTAAAVARATTAGVRAPPTDHGHGEETQSMETPSAREGLDTATREADPVEGQPSVNGLFVLDPRLPVIQAVLEFARENLWMPEYRKLLQARDEWHRSIIEHAIMSGRTQTFETVFDALRKDILDEQIDLMLDPASEPSHIQTSMNRALESQTGTPMLQFVSEKSKSLKGDVSRRKDDSTVVSKIHAFIPGNLIVIFQLLLPEFDEDSDEPLYLLLVLCFVAPFWSWGVAMSTKRDAITNNTRARQTAAKYFLAIPAMFFWGLGTSRIASSSFGWAETAAAAALAVATIVIPAMDTYFSGRGARAAASVITITILELVDGRKAKPAREAERSNQLYGQDDIASGGATTSSRPQGQTLVNINTRQAADTRSLEAGQTQGTGAAGHNLTVAAQGSPSSQLGGPQQSPVGSIWAEDDGAETKL